MARFSKTRVFGVTRARAQLHFVRGKERCQSYFDWQNATDRSTTERNVVAPTKTGRRGNSFGGARAVGFGFPVTRSNAIKGKNSI